MCAAFRDGDVETARSLQLAALPLIQGLFSEVNPIPVKEALAQMGMIEANYRLPLTAMSNGAAQALRSALKEVGLVA